MATKNRIILGALELFNNEGSGKVSTNHIAKFLNISPGNLYYHFSNKEEIIRALLKLMLEEYDNIFNPNTTSTEETMLNQLVFDDREIVLKYRFFYNEISTLCQNDLELKEIFRINQIKREEFFLESFLFLQSKQFIKEDCSISTMKLIVKMIMYSENLRLFIADLDGKKIESIEDLNFDTILLERLIPLYGFLTEKGKIYLNTYKFL